MAKISDLPESQAAAVKGMKVPAFTSEPFVIGQAVSKRRVAMLTTAGLHTLDQPRFRLGDTSYRVIDGNVRGEDLVMSQGSVGFDRTGFQQDVNTLFPIDRLREAQQAGTIGSIASKHYSLMAAFSDPPAFSQVAGDIATLLAQDQVDAAVLIPA
jgi:D-proline reductase (dithiol) PrdB